MSRPMSALGHKRTFAPQKVMSALTLKPDMCSAASDVGLGPLADIARSEMRFGRRGRSYK